MSEQLKDRCKFCDSNSLACESFPKVGADGFYALVWCYDCLAQGPKCDTEAEAIAAWNTRPDQAGWVSVDERFEFLSSALRRAGYKIVKITQPSDTKDAE